MDTFDIPAILAGLSKRRPVFHSEADFQHELAWEWRSRFPTANIRMEYPFLNERRGALDIIAETKSRKIAIELKYLCDKGEFEIGEEIFRLKRQGAHDIRQYDVIKDVSRIEMAIRTGVVAEGIAIVLANDASYWRSRRSGSFASIFEIAEGKLLSGTLAWPENVGPGTSRGREHPIDIAGKYTLAWQPYSSLVDANGRKHAFKFLLIHVGPHYKIC